MNYRIITNGFGSFKIQEKGFFFGWNDYEEEIGWNCSHRPTFGSLQEAEAKIQDLEHQAKVSAAPWTPTHPGKSPEEGGV